MIWNISEGFLPFFILNLGLLNLTNKLLKLLDFILSLQRVLPQDAASRLENLPSITSAIPSTRNHKPLLSSQVQVNIHNLTQQLSRIEPILCRILHFQILALIPREDDLIEGKYPCKTVYDFGIDKRGRNKCGEL